MGKRRGGRISRRRGRRSNRGSIMPPISIFCQNADGIATTSSPIVALATDDTSIDLLLFRGASVRLDFNAITNPAGVVIYYYATNPTTGSPVPATTGLRAMTRTFSCAPGTTRTFRWKIPRNIDYSHQAAFAIACDTTTGVKVTGNITFTCKAFGTTSIIPPPGSMSALSNAVVLNNKFVKHNILQSDIDMSSFNIVNK